MASQLKDILTRHRIRAIDLFRSWDADGNGLVDAAEFREAVRSLGYDAPRSDVDALFASFDVDGSGEISFVELDRALRIGGRQAPNVDGGGRSNGRGGRAAPRALTDGLAYLSAALAVSLCRVP